VQQARDVRSGREPARESLEQDIGGEGGTGRVGIQLEEALELSVRLVGELDQASRVVDLLAARPVPVGDLDGLELGRREAPRQPQLTPGTAREPARVSREPPRAQRAAPRRRTARGADGDIHRRQPDLTGQVIDSADVVGQPAVVGADEPEPVGIELEVAEAQRQQPVHRLRPDGEAERGHPVRDDLADVRARPVVVRSSHRVARLSVCPHGPSPPLTRTAVAAGAIAERGDATAQIGLGWERWPCEARGRGGRAPRASRRPAHAGRELFTHGQPLVKRGSPHRRQAPRNCETDH
jgi:hypothetical protein